jgi:hypothetical protein
VRESGLKESSERVGNINVNITCHGLSNSVIHFKIVTFSYVCFGDTKVKNQTALYDWTSNDRCVMVFVNNLPMCTIVLHIRKVRLSSLTTFNVSSQ